VGALAVAAREANAVGAVRLTLLPRRLEIELLRAGSFADGYVPGGLTRFVRFSVPYSAVRGLVRREHGVILSLDAAAATPYNRFFLTHFTDLPLEALASVHKRRMWATAIHWLVPLPLAAFVVEQAPSELCSGLLGRASAFGLLALGAAYAIGVAAGWARTGSPLSTRLRDVLEMRLAQRMGYEPALVHETDPFDVPIAALEALGLSRGGAGPHDGVAAELQDLAAITPRSAGIEATAPQRALVREVAPAQAPMVLAPQAGHTVRVVPQPDLATLSFSPPRSRWRGRALTIAFAVSATLVAMYGAEWVRELKPQTEAAPIARAGIPANAGPTAEEVAVPTLPACSCDRADSPLWRTGLPALSLLTIPKAPAETIAPVKNRRGRFRYDFDVAVVNNAAEALKDVRVVLTFARRNEKNERVGATDRGLFWEGLLGPAKSVKWGVKAPGTELRVDIDEKRLLGAVPPAPAGGFETLLKAKQPAVRLHAAMMLAYLGDSRAEQAVRSLGELTGESGEIQARILRALRPLKVCDVKFDKGALEACAYNGTEAPISNAKLSEYAPEGGGRSGGVGEPIPKQSGLRVTVPSFGGEAEELELTVP